MDDDERLRMHINAAVKAAILTPVVVAIIMVPILAVIIFLEHVW